MRFPVPPGAALLQRFSTPANQRTDIFTDPDVYNQTTALDMGMLLEDIYQCSQNGGGALSAVFPAEITQTECQAMITHLTRNKIAVLFCLAVCRQFLLVQMVQNIFL